MKSITGLLVVVLWFPGAYILRTHFRQVKGILQQGQTKMRAICMIDRSSPGSRLHEGYLSTSVVTEAEIERGVGVVATAVVPPLFLPITERLPPAVPLLVEGCLRRVARALQQPAPPPLAPLASARAPQPSPLPTAGSSSLHFGRTHPGIKSSGLNLIHSLESPPSKGPWGVRRFRTLPSGRHCRYRIVCTYPYPPS